MKIIKTPLEWDSKPVPSSDWLHSESAEITVDELTMGVETRTGKVAFKQSKSEKEEEVTVAQNRVTFYYTIKTDYRPVAEFEIGGKIAYSSEGDGIAWVALSGESAAESVSATPLKDIADFKISGSSAVTFPYTGGVAEKRFTWIDWGEHCVEVPRNPMSGIAGNYINTGSSAITSVDSASVSSGVDWITADTEGGISAKANDSTIARNGEVHYTFCGKTATVNVTQYGKPAPSNQYFGVKTQSALANGKAATFTISGESGETSKDVDFSGMTNYYIAYITATSDSSVSASCNISKDAINLDSPNPLKFPPTGGTMDVTVNTERTHLNVSNQGLTGHTYTGNIKLDNLYQINDAISTCDYGASVVGDGFEIERTVGETTTISAEENETTSERTGTATFTTSNSPTDTPASATVSLSQPHVNWFSFESTITGSPEETTGTVSFYKSIGSTTGTAVTTVTYETLSDGTKHVAWSGFVDNTGAITYKVDGFDDSAVISASTDSVEFNQITMQQSGDGKYHISGAETAVTVSALGVSYEYECHIGDTSYTYTTIGVIPYNKKLIFNATATTTNEFSVFPYYPSGGGSDSWKYIVGTGDPCPITVKCLALLHPKTYKDMRLEYTLEWPQGLTGLAASAETTFYKPSGATSDINLDNFALSSSTAFWNAYHSNGGKVPTGPNSAYTFAFIPSSRKSFSDVSDKSTAYTNHADLGYQTGTTSGWTLFYPSTSGDVGSTRLQNYAAKVYSLSYAEDILSQQGAGLNDTWYLGPLLYKVGSGAYHEVDGFKFESGSNISLISTNAKEGGGCASLSSDDYNYPTECPFPCSQTISAATQYFMFVNGGQQTASSSTSGAMSGDGVWYFSGKGQGGLNHNTTELRFFNRTKLMRERNFNYQYTTGDTNCSMRLYDTPNAMAHVASGTIKTNLLGGVQIKMIYYGKYSGQNPDVPSTSTPIRVPASEYVVSPTNPGDTSSVVYDEETGDYIIYDVDNVVVLKNMGNNYVVVDASELEQIITQTSGEIIDPAEP